MTLWLRKKDEGGESDGWEVDDVHSSTNELEVQRELCYKVSGEL